MPPLPDLKLLAQQHRWLPEDPLALAIAARFLCEGQPVHVLQEAGKTDWQQHLPPTVTRLHEMPRDPDPTVALVIITDRVIRPRPEVDRLTILRPPTLTLGVACRRDLSHDDLEEAFRLLCQAHGVSPLSLAAVGASQRRKQSAALEFFAENRQLPLLTYPEVSLQRTPLGVPGKMAGTCAVAAILAAGVTAPLAPRQPFFGKMTLALARRASA